MGFVLEKIHSACRRTVRRVIPGSDGSRLGARIVGPRSPHCGRAGGAVAIRYAKYNFRCVEQSGFDGLNCLHNIPAAAFLLRHSCCGIPAAAFLLRKRFQMSGLRYLAAMIAHNAVYVSAHAAPKLTTLYSFKGYEDGVAPIGSLIRVGHVLYGVTEGGNVRDCIDGPRFGCGLLYSLDLSSGNETVAHRFNGGADGKYPVGSLVYKQGILYGSTVGGGTSNSGVLFAFDPKSGRESVLLSFSPQAGIGPLYGLTGYQNALYGSGSSGNGQNGYGAIVKFDLMSKQQSVVYGFKGGVDGSQPQPGAILNGGELFGITQLGGKGIGTVFTINTLTGDHQVIFDFPHSQYPIMPTSLMAAGGGFFGTTWQGGAGYGSVFKITREGAESDVYGFKMGTDGGYPNTLTYANGALYGTTTAGGGGNCHGSNGCGTVFKINPATGAETVLHVFTGGSDGMVPGGALIHYGHAWYGTTIGGGTNSVTCTFPAEGVAGCGTVFKLTE